MKTFVVVLTLSIFSLDFAFAEGEKTISEIHREICSLASQAYPKALPSQELCLQNTELEINPRDFSISFSSCGTGEWVTASYNPSTKEVLIGSSGIENDMCE